MNNAQPQWIKRPTEVPEEVRYSHSIGRGRLIRRQLEELVKAINPAYVETKQKLTYLAQHQARAEMNRIFGYGNWDLDAGEPTLLYEYATPGVGANASKNYWRVGYRIKVTVDIRDLWGMPVASYTGLHAEQNAPQPDRGEAHALALTSVDSYALRRALINLGDRFGLGLYAGGSQAAHGLYTIQLEDDVLYRPWEPLDGQPQVAVQPGAVQINPGADPQQAAQTAQPAIQWGEVEQAQAAPRQPSPQMQAFHGAQETLQEQREEAKAGMQQRLQQGLKRDEGQS